MFDIVFQARPPPSQTEKYTFSRRVLIRNPSQKDKEGPLRSRRASVVLASGAQTISADSQPQPAEGSNKKTTAELFEIEASYPAIPDGGVPREGTFELASSQPVA